MYRDDFDDGECTASPGVMGYKACHRYPECGCEKEEEKDPSERNITEEELEFFLKYLTDDLW